MWSLLMSPHHQDGGARWGFPNLSCQTSPHKQGDRKVRATLILKTDVISTGNIKVTDGKS